MCTSRLKRKESIRQRRASEAYSTSNWSFGMEVEKHFYLGGGEAKTADSPWSQCFIKGERFS
jgi:hypothetical protein